MNRLIRYSDFKGILDIYKPRLNLVDNKLELVLLVSVTGGGRNTIIRELIKTKKYHYLVSDTTRKPRINLGVPEKNGREYWFKSEDEFLEGLKQGRYLEAAIIHEQQVSGLNISELEKALDDNLVPITDIEIEGAKTLLSLELDNLAIFLLPPSFDEWLRRLDERGSLESDEKKRRLKSALSELQYAIGSDQFYFISNDDLESTTDLVDRFIMSREKSLVDQQNERQKAHKLLKKLESYLYN